jgi:hypothetical protein
MASPYEGIPEEKWLKKTEKLIAKLPVTKEELVSVVLDCWKDIFESSFGKAGYKIGVDIFPKPQIIGFLLHELIPLELASRKNNEWRVDKAKDEKDLVCIKDKSLSIELKTSSHATQIFGNRSYAQESKAGKKDKTGYYLTVNFGKFTGKGKQPEITQICIGWLDHSDWKGQTAQTGQQASISHSAQHYKLIKIYPNKAV